MSRKGQSCIDHSRMSDPLPSVHYLEESIISWFQIMYNYKLMPLDMANGIENSALGDGLCDAIIQFIKAQDCWKLKLGH